MALKSIPTTSKVQNAIAIPSKASVEQQGLQASSDGDPAILHSILICHEVRRKEPGGSTWCGIYALPVDVLAKLASAWPARIEPPSQPVSLYASGDVVQRASAALIATWACRRA
eukprot:CAMPEP_0197688268 /NCGR_PEP_ID=MMETSP1338-20131121/105180_1 /TAXON_ID=43686 ORGANISM="Pelagodinium beii, Strain RCC1491" /NCGR_SAMPLE_ID=MMETSP1338 /ASSEMBLY_ACC=CAM_ASM_000754 /LENGTH=113 /DNA_ID=CAMNT_0043270461 /DNA_START=245 /DNA_END=583 /DNA_ORIENTATION=+